MSEAALAAVEMMAMCAVAPQVAAGTGTTMEMALMETASTEAALLEWAMLAEVSMAKAATVMKGMAVAANKRGEIKRLTRREQQGRWRPSLILLCEC